jgi:predicted deacylase
MKRFFILIITSFIILLHSCCLALASDAFGEYPAPEDMYAGINALANEFPGYVTVGEYGRSVEGRPLLFIRIALPDGAKRPEALIAANIHGNEWIGNRMAMAAARRLLEGSDTDPWVASLLKKMEFWILPCINPDGYVKTWDERKNEKAQWADMRKNAHGVDLNRNFPLPAGRTVEMEMAGSSDPNSIRYTGSSPYSEPETQAVRDFVKEHHFFAAIDFHSNWGTLFPPKCNGSACEKQFKKMLAAATGRQARVKYAVVAAWQVDSFSGEMEDTLFYDYGIMAVCWEIFTQSAANDQQKDPALQGPFWSMNPKDIFYWVDNDRDAALAALEAAYDVTGGSPVPEESRKVRLK